MPKTIVIQHLIFDDFHKDEYRAFKVEGQPDCISLPTICDRLKDILMQLERQMEAGDHLAITLSVNRPAENPFEVDVADIMLQRYTRSMYGSPYGASHP